MNPVHLSAEFIYGCCEEHPDRLVGISVTPMDIRPPKEKAEIPEPSERKKVRGWRTTNSW